MGSCCSQSVNVALEEPLINPEFEDEIECSGYGTNESLSCSDNATEDTYNLNVPFSKHFPNQISHHSISSSIAFVDSLCSSVALMSPPEPDEFMIVEPEPDHFVTCSVLKEKNEKLVVEMEEMEQILNALRTENEKLKDDLKQKESERIMVRIDSMDTPKDNAVQNPNPLLLSVPKDNAADR